MKKSSWVCFRTSTSKDWRKGQRDPAYGCNEASDDPTGSSGAGASFHNYFQLQPGPDPSIAALASCWPGATREGPHSGPGTSLPRALPREGHSCEPLAAACMGLGDDRQVFSTEGIPDWGGWQGQKNSPAERNTETLKTQHPKSQILKAGVLPVRLEYLSSLLNTPTSSSGDPGMCRVLQQVC